MKIRTLASLACASALAAILACATIPPAPAPASDDRRPPPHRGRRPDSARDHPAVRRARRRARQGPHRRLPDGVERCRRGDRDDGRPREARRAGRAHRPRPRAGGHRGGREAARRRHGHLVRRRGPGQADRRSRRHARGSRDAQAPRGRGRPRRDVGRRGRHDDSDADGRGEARRRPAGRRPIRRVLSPRT